MQAATSETSLKLICANIGLDAAVRLFNIERHLTSHMNGTMDWDLHRFFVAVAEAGDYSGAAQRLRSSHPTVSRKIAALEAELGTRLFVRTPEGLALTAQGRRLREHADAMALAASRAEAAVAARGAAARGAVKLSIGPTLAAHWLMPRMGAVPGQPPAYRDRPDHPSVPGQRAPARSRHRAAGLRDR